MHYEELAIIRKASFGKTFQNHDFKSLETRQQWAIRGMAVSLDQHLSSSSKRNEMLATSRSFYTFNPVRDESLIKIGSAGFFVPRKQFRRTH